jgi:hypothetical protein
MASGLPYECCDDTRSSGFFRCSVPWKLGAFFLFVPVLSIATVVGILVGLMLMFGLGYK